MRMPAPSSRIPALLALLHAALPRPAPAHCDGWDGPVAVAARKALDSNQVERVLMWVTDMDADSVRRAFLRARSVRVLDGEARLVADTYFLETVVRLHCAAEGVPFTGLKPAGRDLGPAIPAADRALNTGSAAPLRALLEGAYRKRLDSLHGLVRSLQHHSPKDMQGGRRFVAAYLEYIHYVEGLHAAATARTEGHFREPQEAYLCGDRVGPRHPGERASWESAR